MTYLQSPPYSMYRDSEKRLEGNDIFEGYAPDLIKEIAQELSEENDGSRPFLTRALLSCVLRVQLHLQMGGRPKVRETRSGNRRMERHDGRTSGAGNVRRRHMKLRIKDKVLVHFFLVTTWRETVLGNQEPFSRLLPVQPYKRRAHRREEKGRRKFSFPSRRRFS